MALAIYLLSATVLLAMSVAGLASLYPFAAALFIIIAMLGFIMPVSGMLAMEVGGRDSGDRGGAYGGLSIRGGRPGERGDGRVSNGSTMPMAVCIFVCGLVSASLSLLAFPKHSSETVMR